VSRVVVHVDRLVLRGVDARDGQAVAAGLQAELTRMLAEPGVASQWGAVRDLPPMRLPRVRIHDGAGVGWQSELGGAAARGIGKAMRR
jgi:hypothetical protein